MKFFLFICAFVLCIPQMSFAAKTCYNPREAEAEQGIRIHSELMVIGLNCAHMADVNGNNLYLEHKKFTKKHSDLFQTYEKIIMDHMDTHGQSNPEKAMHTMRTKFANKISNDVAQMRPDIFCRTYATRIEKAAKMSRETLRKWAATPYDSYPVSYPLCEKDKENPQDKK